MGYRPLGAARELWLSRAPVVVASGPAGTGKTRAALEKALLFAYNHPGARILLTRATRASLSESTLAILEAYVFPPNAPWAQGASRSARQRYELPNGSEIVLVGCDNADRIMSAEYDLIVCDESTELEEDQAEKLCSRLRGHAAPYTQAIFCCNPGAPTHFLKQWCDSGRATMIASKHEDNPTLTEDYIARLASLTGHRKERLYYGHWASASGVVFDLSNCVSEHEAPPAGDLIGAFDFGFSAPAGALMAVSYSAEQPTLYVFAERELANCPLEGHVQWLLQYPDAIIYCDPENPEGRQELCRQGIMAVPANNRLIHGIDRVCSLIERGALLISEKCEKLLARAAAYEYDTDGIKPKKDHVNDHLCDCLRYLCVAASGGMDSATAQTQAA